MIEKLRALIAERRDNKIVVGNTFEDELNYWSGRSFYLVAIVFVMGMMNTYLIPLIGIILILRVFIKPLKNRNDILLMIIMGILYLSILGVAPEALRWTNAAIESADSNSILVFIDKHGFHFNYAYIAMLCTITVMVPLLYKFKVICVIIGVILLVIVGVREISAKAASADYADFAALIDNFEMHIFVAGLLLLASLVFARLQDNLLKSSWEQRKNAMLATKAKSDFLASMSHEIRTPMNAVIGMSEILLRQDLPSEAYENVHIIKQAGNNLMTIIDDILDLSKIESGKLEIVPVEYNLQTLFDDVCNIIKIRVKKSIDFSEEIDENLPSVLYGDETRIRQILTNLLSNAVKYTSEGFVRFNITGTTVGDKLTLSITIADSGIGIKQENLHELFDDFSRFDQEKHRNIEGVGLGLTITKKLCEMMDGDIRVKSVYGEGSTFTVTIVQEIRDKTPISAIESRSSDTKSRENIYYIKAPTAHILVVDDSATNLKVMEGLLEPFKMRVDTCLSGMKAIELAGQNEYDIIFMDYLMPDMDGIEAMQKIRGLPVFGGFYKTAPIIALTASAISGMKEMYLESGFSEFLAKPIELLKLSKTLSVWLPAEKQMAGDVDDYVKVAEAVDFTIDGVDVQMGITRTGGTVMNYLRTLEFFLSDSNERLEEIPNCLADNDVGRFVIYVHALKSAAGNIGAIALSEKAAPLESAGKRNDMEYIIENIGDFMGDLAVLTHNISVHLKPVEAKVSDEICYKFIQLETALSEFDIGRIDELVAELGNDLPGDIAKKILTSDYEEAVRLIRGVVDEWS